MGAAGAAEALILAPAGRDAEVAAALMKAAGIPAVICADLPHLSRSLSEEVGLVVLTEEVVRTADLRQIADWISAQPSWSDLPFILLTGRGGGTERNPMMARLMSTLGNVTLLERPFHPTTFVSVVQAALRGRRRQYEARAHFEELRRLNETLEERVVARTEELERAHADVLRQIAERERAEEKLRQAQKMETVGQLTGGVAHDFNNLLMAVLGNLDLLRKHVSNDPKAVRLISGALQGAKRGAALTQRLLAFARRQDLQVRPVDLAALVHGMTDLLQRSLGPGIDLRLQLDGASRPAVADSNQVELALLNLAVNARDAMPKGGILTIELDTAEACAGDPELRPGPYIRLAVTDTGCGMDADTLKRAVEPFFSTKELGKGTGLGLSMIHGLAVQLKGKLRLTSEVGRGTRAELWLPAATATPKEEPAMPAAKAAFAANGRATILVVDDDVLIAMSTVDMLEDLGHEVIEAHSGARALEILRNGQAIDLMITDQAMPKMTGVQLARAARGLRPDLPILLATGYADPFEGADLDLPRLAKPYQQEQLATQIAKILPATRRQSAGVSECRMSPGQPGALQEPAGDAI